MKIGMVIRSCRRNSATRYVFEVAERLARGNEVHIFANGWDEFGGRIATHKVPALAGNFYLYEASMLLAATAIMKLHKFDVTMAQPTRYFSPDVGYMQFVYREWANRLKGDGIKSSFFGNIHTFIEKMNVKKARKIIVMSQSLKNEVLKNYNVPEEKVEVIYSGVNCAEFAPENRKLCNSDMRKKLGIEENDIVLLFVGNPFWRKGLEYVIRALPLINEKSIKLLVSGNDNPDRYKELAKRLGAHEKIRWNIGLTNEINKFFASADIFVFPTLYEPFGLVITDAMASGLPVVVSRRAGAAELIEDGKSGLLLDNPKNPREIAKKVNYLIDNNLYRKMGKAARAKAETLTWDNTAQQMLSVLEEAAEMKRRNIRF